MKEFYSDYDSLLECFSSMTVDGGASDKQAFEYFREKTTPDLMQKLQARIANGAHLRGLPNEAADFPQLVKYLEAGFELYPCKPITEKDGVIKYLPYNPRTGTLSLYDSETQKQNKERHGIKSAIDLQRLIATQGIELFRVFPLDNSYIVIDIDTHTDKDNGLLQWYNFIKLHGLDAIDYYKDLSKFPCYVETPSGYGKHLYFKLIQDKPRHAIKNLASSLEVSSESHTENAAGSYRKDKKRHYILHGNFSDAPILPNCIYEAMQDKPQPQTAARYKKTYASYDKSAKWNKTLEGIASKAREKHTGGNHDFICAICRYAKNANESGDTYYTKSEIENFIFSLPEAIQHESKDKGDTQGVINSYFGA